MARLSPKSIWNDMLIALALLTRLPVPHADFSDTSRPPARAAWAYPIAGVVAALPAVAVALIGSYVYAEGPVLAFLVLGTLILTTGAMHEDGLADCADGFWGGQDKARRLEIMKDSAIGTYGVLALFVVSGVRWSAMGYWLTFAEDVLMLLVIAALSRAPMVVVMQVLPHARGDGLSKATGAPGGFSVSMACALAIVVAGLGFLLSRTDMIVLPYMLAAVAMAGLATSYVAKQKIGGQTGDVLGATQQLAEAALWITVTTAFSGMHFDPV